ncbi:MAG TPA: efflux RND transporter periplasmic adaptor subunit, partial [Isosphaeraceae bacterium]|nr:efflux RND transporter periplasmic adaptor subunit [Isosphaeraceae bacterium]
LTALFLPACNHSHADDHGGHHGHQKIVVTSPERMDVVITQPYVCQIHARRHIEVRPLEEGYLEQINVKEGQAVEKDQVMFKVVPILYKARLAAEKAELQFAEVELANTRKLFEKGIVSEQEVKLYEAKVAAKKAKVGQTQAELDFTNVKAPFDGIMDRQRQQQGSLVKKEEVLTTLSDNAVMWVYFYVPEARYLAFKARQEKDRPGRQYQEQPVRQFKTEDEKIKAKEKENQSAALLEIKDANIELILADGRKFDQSCGNTVTIEGQFNNQTGNIAFRADFPNPNRLLRHGQTGTILIRQNVRDALVIPQRATFEILDRRYVWVVGDDHVVHQRLITVRNELEDAFVIDTGLDVKDKIILEGVREVQDGEKIEFEYRSPEEALENQKFRAE